MRILALLGLAVAGLAIGIIGGFVQADRAILDSPWGLLVIPWGTVLMLIVLLLAIRGAAWAVHARSGGWLLFGGWLVGTVLLAVDSPSGDTAISAGARQWAYLLIGVVIGAACATFPVRRSLTIVKPPG